MQCNLIMNACQSIIPYNVIFNRDMLIVCNDIMIYATYCDIQLWRVDCAQRYIPHNVLFIHDVFIMCNAISHIM